MSAEDRRRAPTSAAETRSSIASPTLDGREREWEVKLAKHAATTLAIGPFLYAAYRTATSLQNVPLGAVLPSLGVSLMSMLALALIRFGRIPLASTVMIAGAWSGLAYLSTNLGGIRDAGYAGFMIVVVTAGLLRGWRLSVVVLASTLVLGWLLVVAELQGTLPEDTDTATEVFFNYVALFAIATGVVTAARTSYESLVQRLRKGGRDLHERNLELQEMRETLETRVAERTSDLDRRTRYFAAAAQIAYAAGEILDVDELMATSVKLIKDAFELYYVGFFVVDATQEWALLRAGTGDAGQRMLARQHRIPVGEGMIGWCIANAESRYAQHADADSVRLVMPELPETQAEAALPLRARGRVLGALTVQSTMPDFFDSAIITVLQTMADLLAVALSNAELHAESQQAVAAVRKAYGEISARAWEELLRTRGDWGYALQGGTVRPVSGAWGDTTLEAMQLGGLVREAASVAVPLRVGEKVVGAITYHRRPDADPWQTEDVAALETIADQLSQSLDSARLLQESQLQAARERQLSEISQRLADAVDVETMLRSAAQALGTLPGVLEASVHIALPEAQEDAQEAGSSQRVPSPHSVGGSYGDATSQQEDPE